MTIYIASDHAGYELKQKIYHHLYHTCDTDYDLIDLGCYKSDSVDYPDFAKMLCERVTGGDFGILVCGTGQGMNMCANKYPHIRSALVYNYEIAALAREHNNANVICLGSRFTTDEQAISYINTFLNTRFSNEPRHRDRVEKMNKINA